MTTSVDEMIHINVIIADRPYRLKVKPAEEEVVRNAARKINGQVLEFQRRELGMQQPGRLNREQENQPDEFFHEVLPVDRSRFYQECRSVSNG